MRAATAIVGRGARNSPNPESLIWEGIRSPLVVCSIVNPQSSISNHSVLPLTRRQFASSLALAATAVAIAPRRLGGAQPEAPAAALPLTDLHVHLSSGLSLEQAVALAASRGMKFGIVDHPGANTGAFRRIETDAELQAYIAALRPHPVYVGLQPVYPGWSKPFAPATLAQLDYVLMDALTMPDGRGGWRYLWAADTFIEDEEEFMREYVSFIHRLLDTERIDIFAWPTFLPAAIAREYAALWTTARREALIEHLRAKHVALEINEVARVPDEAFVARAKAAGVKFSFGTDARNHNAGRFTYCRRIAAACGLTAADLFTVPARA
jgi:histidinol phosphatase-like PHP family hydrolase